MDLNKNQHQAVTYTGGPLLILAGAGTGKTTVITQRIQYLMTEQKCSPEQVVALTFTEKAAQEMVERLDKIMPFGYEEPWVHTFHGFCDRILREEGLEIGLPVDYDILSRAEQWILVKKNLFKFPLDYYRPLGNPSKFIHAIIQFFSRLQDEDIALKEMEQFRARAKEAALPEEKEWYQRYLEVLNAYEYYQKLKLEDNKLDFGDLINWTLTLLRVRPWLRKKYQNQFRHVLVDEFQDTNVAQLQLIKLLAPPQNSPNLTVVGDDDQSIYAFRGSSVHNILDFKKHYPTAKEVVLNTNYRSGQGILNAAYKVIQHNNPDRLEVKLGLDKRLVAARGKKIPNPKIIEVSSLEMEAEFVCTQLVELLGKDYSYKDVSVIARANSYLDPFVTAFKRVGFPYQLIGNRGLFDQEEIRYLFFFLRCAVDPHDSMSLFYFLHATCFNLDPSEVLSWLTKANQQKVSLYEWLKKDSQTTSTAEASAPPYPRRRVGDKAADPVNRILTLIETAMAVDTKSSITQLVHRFILDSNYLKPYLDETSIDGELRIKNINLFFSKLKEFDTNFPHSGLSQAIEYFDLLIEAGENPAQAEIEDVDTISLLTIHAAKGLEWPIVFLVNTVADRFPSRSRSDAIPLPDTFVKQLTPEGDYHLQEERRLFYVAVTRARDYFFAIHGKDYGGQRPKKPSLFIKELLESDDVKPIEWQPKASQLSWFQQIDGVAAPKPQRIADGKLELSYVSFSQLETYQTCPLQYKYRYILGIPTVPHHAYTFGNTIHATLQNFHQQELKGNKLSLDTLLDIYKQLFQPYGYESQEHKNQRYESGVRALTHYFKEHTTIFPGKRWSLEKSFRIPLEEVPLVGRIDRLDLLDDVSAQDVSLLAEDGVIPVEVIDYKTGRVKDQKTVDRDAQLTIYALAVSTMYGAIPKYLSLYFVEDGVKVTTTRTAKQIERKKTEIKKTLEKIKTGKFEAKPGIPCHYCPYNTICPFAVRG